MHILAIAIVASAAFVSPAAAVPAHPSPGSHPPSAITRDACADAFNRQMAALRARGLPLLAYSVPDGKGGWRAEPIAQFQESYIHDCLERGTPPILEMAPILPRRSLDTTNAT